MIALPNLSRMQPVWKALKKPISVPAKRLLGAITRAETHEPVLALSFDDGPHPDYTPRILELLARYRARATFFCLGKMAVKYPQVIRQIGEAGHVVANHTWSHPSLPLLPRAERRAQIRKCAEALKPYGTRLFRPPYGHLNLASRFDLLQLGYQVVGWTHGGSDWCLTDPERILECIVPAIRPGSILVFHDGMATSQSPAYFDRTPSIKALELLFERYGDRYRFATVPELSRYGHVKWEKWLRPADPSWLNKLIEEGNSPSRQYPLIP